MNVVLDENIFVRGLVSDCGGSDKQTDERAARVVGFIQQGHCWIFSDEIVTAYRKHIKIQRCDKGPTRELIIKSFHNVMADSSRHQWLHDFPEVEGDYSPKDHHVVTAAAQVGNGCCLATMDGRLRESLEKDNIPARWKFRVSTLDDAETLLEVKRPPSDSPPASRR